MTAVMKPSKPAELTSSYAASRTHPVGGCMALVGARLTIAFMVVDHCCCSLVITAEPFSSSWMRLKVSTTAPVDHTQAERRDVMRLEEAKREEASAAMGCGGVRRGEADHATRRVPTNKLMAKMPPMNIHTKEKMAIGEKSLRSGA